MKFLIFNAIVFCSLGYLLTSSPNQNFNQWFVDKKDKMVNLSKEDYIKKMKSAVSKNNHDKEVENKFNSLSNQAEIIINSWKNTEIQYLSNKNKKVKSILPTAVVCSIRSGEKFEPPAQLSDEYEWYLSTSGVPDSPVGSRILPGANVPEFSSYRLPIRILGLSNLSKEI